MPRLEIAASDGKDSVLSLQRGGGEGKKDVKPCLSHSWHLPTDPANVTGRVGDTDVPIPNPEGRTPVGDDMFD
jgi:hypothetical protein